MNTIDGQIFIELWPAIYDSFFVALFFSMVVIWIFKAIGK